MAVHTGYSVRPTVCWMSHKDYAVVMRHQKKKCILVNQSGDMPAQSQKRQGKTTGNHFKFKLNCGYYTHTHTHLKHTTPLSIQFYLTTKTFELAFPHAKSNFSWCHQLIPKRVASQGERSATERTSFKGQKRALMCNLQE